MSSNERRGISEDNVNIEDKQRDRLRRIIVWAKRIREGLQPLLDTNGHRVHFRPSANGFSMVGLLDEAPQVGKSSLTDPTLVVEKFEELFSEHCSSPPKRVTGEKALQAFLIRDAYTHERKLREINKASPRSNDPATLTFVTDEIALPVKDNNHDGKIVCDVLAWRADPRAGGAPVVMELKDQRAMTRLIEQTTAYARLIDRHADLFGELFSALLGENIRFTTPTEKWVVWPASEHEPDPREAEFASHGIRLVSYKLIDGSYTFHVGDLPSH